MKINATKTQLLCINDNSTARVKSYIDVEDSGRISSSEEMKIIGFTFGEKPTVKYHIDHTIIKFKKKLWMLNHLKKANLDKNVLLKVYMSMLRPILEYCSPVYHPMLNCSMKEELEKMQKPALKIIFGFDKEYAAILAENNIQSLEKRREDAFLNYATKLSNSERFKEWFPEQEHKTDLRQRKKYREDFARTNRLYNSPIYAMRRLLNEINI